MPISNNDLAHEVLNKNLIRKKILDALLAQAQIQNSNLEELISEREVIPDDVLGGLMAELYKVPFVKLSEQTISEKLLPIVPYNMAKSQYVLPFEETANELKIALNNPENYEFLSFIGKKTGLKILPFYATKKDIKNSLKIYTRDVNEKFNKLLKGVMKDPNKVESLKDAAKILDTIIMFAFQNNASDIHIESHKRYLIVRNRIDGILQTIAELPLSISDLIITRIKVLAALRTDEHRAAQDGRFKIDLENNEITMRVSIVPTYYGEKTVLRLLSSSAGELNLEALGYSRQNLKIIQDNILKTHGMILMTGPTGSGKTTTLYSLLKLLNSPEVNISTIEDPIEYSLEGINQIQVNVKTNLTFANGLRSLLRQDPDIIMVGEIRDEETASIAINAALTGHLVLATLHTNDAASTLPRMLEMNVESFLLADTAQMVIAQRLVRKICPKCKQSFEVSPEQLNKIAEKYGIKQDLAALYLKLSGIKEIPAHIRLYKGEGCASCAKSGYKGRKCIAEVMEVSPLIKKALRENASVSDITALAVKEGMIPLFIDGIVKAFNGVTTIEEILRVMKN